MAASLTATVVSGTRVDLQWADAGRGCNVMIVRNGVLIANYAHHPRNPRTYTDTGLFTGTTYWYQIFIEQDCNSGDPWTDGSGYAFATTVSYFLRRMLPATMRFS